MCSIGKADTITISQALRNGLQASVSPSCISGPGQPSPAGGAASGEDLVLTVGAAGVGGREDVQVTLRLRGNINVKGKGVMEIWEVEPPPFSGYLDQTSLDRTVTGRDWVEGLLSKEEEEVEGELGGSHTSWPGGNGPGAGGEGRGAGGEDRAQGKAGGEAGVGDRPPSMERVESSVLGATSVGISTTEESWKGSWDGTMTSSKQKRIKDRVGSDGRLTEEEVCLKERCEQWKRSRKETCSSQKEA